MEEEALVHGFNRLSLSVNPHNPAMRLYEAVGYMVVRGADDAVTMLQEIG